MNALTAAGLGAAVALAYAVVSYMLVLPVYWSNPCAMMVWPVLGFLYGLALKRFCFGKRRVSLGRALITGAMAGAGAGMCVVMPTLYTWFFEIDRIAPLDDKTKGRVWGQMLGASAGYLLLGLGAAWITWLIVASREWRSPNAKNGSGHDS